MVEDEEDRAELMRLLYVATTRAADYLVLSAGLEKMEKPVSPWMELLATRFDLASGRFLGENAPAAQTPDLPPPLVRVVTRVPLRRRKRPARRRNLEKLAAEARKKAARLETVDPESLRPVTPDPQARREFSFSRLTGRLHSRLTCGVWALWSTR